MRGLKVDLKLSGIARWIVGLFFLLVSFGFISEGSILGFLLAVLITVVCISPIAAPIEKKVNISMSGPVRFVLVFIMLMGFGVVSPHTSTTQTTNVSASPSDIHMASAIVPSATPVTTKTPTSSHPTSNSDSGTSAAVTNATSAQDAVYGDTEWITYVQDSTKTISEDLNDISTSAVTAANTGNYNVFLNQCQGLKLDTDLILKEDVKYNISPKYQEAHKQWIAGVQDLNYAGDVGVKNAKIKMGMGWNIDNGLEDMENHILDGKNKIQRSIVLIQSS